MFAFNLVSWMSPSQFVNRVDVASFRPVLYFCPYWRPDIASALRFLPGKYKSLTR